MRKSLYDVKVGDTVALQYSLCDAPSLRRVQRLTDRYVVVSNSYYRKDTGKELGGGSPRIYVPTVEEIPEIRVAMDRERAINAIKAFDWSTVSTNTLRGIWNLLNR